MKYFDNFCKYFAPNNNNYNLAVLLPEYRTPAVIAIPREYRLSQFALPQVTSSGRDTHLLVAYIFLNV